MSKRILLFTDSTPFGYDVIETLHQSGLLSEVYIQISDANTRLRRYFADLKSPRGIKRRMIGLVDRLNRPHRKMSVIADHGISQNVGAIPFTRFSDLRSQISAKDAVVVVYGTGIVPRWVYKDSFQTINVHWGLSPYYRGILCTDWAILNQDLKNIGFTLHELSGEVDGGRIITQGRVKVMSGDTVGSITTRLHHDAKHQLRSAIQIAQHRKLGSIKQDLSIGKNYTSPDWTVKSSILLRIKTPINQMTISNSQPERPIHQNFDINPGIKEPVA